MKFKKSNHNEFPSNICDVVSYTYRMARKPPTIPNPNPTYDDRFLDDEWLFISCALVDFPRKNLIIWLGVNNNEECFVPVYVNIDELEIDDTYLSESKNLDPIVACVLELLEIFTIQMSPSDALTRNVTLPLHWNPLL